jgi:hypothetical protein
VADLGLLGASGGTRGGQSGPAKGLGWEFGHCVLDWEELMSEVVESRDIFLYGGRERRSVQ